MSPGAHGGARRPRSRHDRAADERAALRRPRGRALYHRAWFGHLDAATKTLATFSAGQGPLLRYDAARDEWEELPADMPPLGIVRRPEIELPAPIVMAPGDVYAVLSDGFFEAAAPSGELFETERVVAALGAARRGTPDEMLRAVRAAVDEFTKGAPAADDRTAVIVKCVR